MLGTGKQEVEPKLLLLMMLQQEKYDKWLFRVLMVVSELMVRRRDAISYILLTIYCSRSARQVVEYVTSPPKLPRIVVRFLCLWDAAVLFFSVPACVCASAVAEADGIRAAAKPSLGLTCFRYSPPPPPGTHPLLLCPRPMWSLASPPTSD